MGTEGLSEKRSRGAHHSRRRHAALACSLLLLGLLLPPATAQSQAPGASTEVETLLASMTVEERVGQLFLVAFVGNGSGPSSDIARLIREDHVGGVVLLASNANFYNDVATPRQVADLANALQALAMEQGPRVPLFVAVDHEGDDYPYTRITAGTTPLPNAMAIGATWDPTNARAVGQITGLELAAMGINLLLGPSLDVLEAPQPGGQGDLGTRTFGGNPWWVGQMGRAYIEGVHQGSGGRVATVAKHFPGHGGSDRLPDEEVATVDKSVEDLKRIELAPFMTVTAQEGSVQGMTDGLMSSHIRYRGVQRNVRQFTAPISFDAEGMATLLKLEPLATWRSTGLMVSDSLGVPAVRKYFDPTLQSFPHRLIAKEAFLAGNDLLLLAQFDLEDAWAGQFENIRDTISFFGTEYRRDPSFAARVDEAVRRILGLKLELYPEFTPEAVQVHAEASLQVCGLGTEVTQQVADQALTLLYPDANALPAPPRRGEKIVIFSDARPVRDCVSERCQPFSPLSRTAVEEELLRNYGPEGTGQVDPADVTSLPFGQLKAFLAGEETETDIGLLLGQADWVILAQQDLNLVKGPNSDAVKLFLNSRTSAALEARLVVLAFSAPYYLDTTEISKLSLYLGAYSKTEPFIRAAVRALFGELLPTGAPPVDVAGINYDLERQLAPDPDQILPLVRVEPATSAPALPPVAVTLLAGPILDHNGRLVPDGTAVTFYAEYEEGTYLAPLAAVTIGGRAQASLDLQAPGEISFRVESGQARRSQIVELVVQPAATDTPSPTATATPPLLTATATAMAATAMAATPLPTSSPTPSPTVTVADRRGGDRSLNGGRAAGVQDLLLACGGVGVAALVGYPLLGRARRRRSVVVRWLLMTTAAGLAVYVLYALGLLPKIWTGPATAAGLGAWADRLAMVGLVALASLLPLGLLRRGGSSA
jgi:beta-N-acetylhexosaminidase